MHTRQENAPGAPDAADPHEILTGFEDGGFRLNATLHDMLNEHHSHRTERRGAGYTQATRHLAEHVNNPRAAHEYDDLRLFASRDLGQVRALVDAAAAHGVRLAWRNLDRCAPPDAIRRDQRLSTLYGHEALRQGRLRALPGQFAREESRLLAAIIVELVLPATGPPQEAVELRPWPEKLAIGTCPLAEKYFLELADGFVRRTGQVNVIVSGHGAPLLMEKMNLGDNHSCISVAPILFNGVLLPPGSLFGVSYADDTVGLPNRELPGRRIPAAQCDGFRFLRLTTLAVSPENRRRAFTAHFDAQVQGGLFSPGAATIKQIEAIAWKQVCDPPVAALVS